jgi:hypothetical protein
MDMSGAYDETCPPHVWEPIINDLRSRFGGFEVPGEAFDPSVAPRELLRAYGLPPRPDAKTQPLLRRVWNKGFGRPIALRSFMFETALVRASIYRPSSRQADRASPEETRFEKSSNWSGAYITANRYRKFMQVWGHWRIPSNLHVPPTPFAGEPGISYMCSNWIGLDGQRRYLDSSLPQIGTASTLLADGTTTAEAWTQWWARGDADTAPLPIGLKVAPGDEVLCVLTALDPQTVVFVMVNLSAVPVPEGMAVLGISPSVTLSDNSVVHPDIAGATAEWIVERPRVLGQSTQYNFPDYRHTEFSSCVAIEADSVDISSLVRGVPQELRGERFIRMFDVLANPSRTAYISMPRKLNDTSIGVKYGGF